MSKRSKSSHRWLSRQRQDPYVSQAKQSGYRSRAVFKLKEIQEKFQVVRPGMRVVDLGAAPGSWSQVAVQWVGTKGQVYALDILAMKPISGVVFLQGDFSTAEMVTQFRDFMENHTTDVVLSDIAPNVSGDKDVDQLRMIQLAEMVFYFCQLTLKIGGSLVIKLFQGIDFDVYLKNLRQHFEKVKIHKPKASRKESREVYLVATAFKGANDNFEADER